MPSVKLLVLSNKFILYRLLDIIAIGFIFDNNGAFLSINTFISGDIRPDRKDRNRVIIIEIMVFAPGLFLLDDPIKIPNEIPNKFPRIINIIL